MIQLSNPNWLYALAGLVIPIAIHLLSRKEGKTIKFGSIRFLQESTTTQFSSIRLNEILLLLLRSLLLLSVVLFIAGLSFDLKQKEKWLLVEPGLEKEKNLQPLFDSLSKEGFQKRYFTKDFPALSDAPGNIDNTWSLIESLESSAAEDAIVVSYNLLENFKGKQISEPKKVRLISYPKPEKTFVANATLLSGDSIFLTTGTALSTETFFVHEKRLSFEKGFLKEQDGDSVRVNHPDSITIKIITDKNFERDRELTKAMLDAIQTITPTKIIVDNEQAQLRTDWTIALTEQPIDQKLAKVIAYTNCGLDGTPTLVKNSKSILSCEGQNAEWLLTKHLNEFIITQENITLQLASIILEEDVKKFKLLDHRTMPEQMIWSKNNKLKISKARPEIQSPNEYLAFLILAILLLERVVAYKRNQ